MRLLNYFLRRFVIMLLTLWVITTLTFFLMKLLPGTPFNDDKLNPDIRRNLEIKYGLDKPIPEQYIVYLGNVVRGDLGISFRSKNRTVNDIIAQKLKPSAIIGGQAMLIGIPMGILLGILAALRRNTPLDYVSVILAVAGAAIPPFVAAALLQYYVGVKLGWLPVARWGTFEHTILPTIAIALGTFAYYTRMMRSEMLEIIGQDYIKTAKAKGVSYPVIVIKHALRNAMIPLVTILPVAILFGLTGSLTIEQIFNVPGLGTELVRSVTTNDYTVTMGLTLFYGALYIVALFLVDIAYGLVDPRIRLTGGASE